HGGSIEASSEGADRGSTFQVILPLLPQPAASPGSEPLGIGSATLDGLSVLLVDDEADAREAMAVLLRQAGARVTSARSAAEAMVAFTREPPDLLLSDIAMPGEDGYGLIRRIRTLP